MQRCEMLRHPIVEVEINGNIAEKRPSEFKLCTYSGLHSVNARLLYPADSDIGKPNENISVSLITDDKKDLYFTGEIYAAATRSGKYRELFLTDSYKKLCAAHFTAAYRKEKASVILEDILSASGISEKSSSCPGTEIARFSTDDIPARLCVDFLIDALALHGAAGLNYFFDAKDIFHFGARDGKGKNEGEAESFESGKNILRSGADWIEALPRPIRHTQAVSVNGKERFTTKTELIASQKNTRLILSFGEAL